MFLQSVCLAHLAFERIAQVSAFKPSFGHAHTKPHPKVMRSSIVGRALEQPNKAQRKCRKAIALCKQRFDYFMSFEPLPRAERIAGRGVWHGRGGQGNSLVVGFVRNRQNAADRVRIFDDLRQLGVFGAGKGTGFFEKNAQLLVAILQIILPLFGGTMLYRCFIDKFIFRNKM